VQRDMRQQRDNRPPSNKSKDKSKLPKATLRQTNLSKDKKARIIKDAMSSYLNVSKIMRYVSVAITTLGAITLSKLFEPTLQKMVIAFGGVPNGDMFTILNYLVMGALMVLFFVIGRELEESNYNAQKMALLKYIDVGLITQYVVLGIYVAVFVHVMILGSSTVFLGYIVLIAFISWLVSGAVDFFQDKEFSAPIFHSTLSLLIALTTAFIGYYFDGDRLGYLFNQSGITELKKSEQYRIRLETLDTLKASYNRNDSAVDNYLSNSDKASSNIAESDTRFIKQKNENLAKIQEENAKIIKMKLIADDKNTEKIQKAQKEFDDWYSLKIAMIEDENKKVSEIVQYAVFILNFIILFFNLSSIRVEFKDSDGVDLSSPPPNFKNANRNEKTNNHQNYEKPKQPQTNQTPMDREIKPKNMVVDDKPKYENLTTEEPKIKEKNDTNFSVEELININNKFRSSSRGDREKFRGGFLQRASVPDLEKSTGLKANRIGEYTKALLDTKHPEITLKKIDGNLVFVDVKDNL
jgi:hypothetical protein